MFERLTHPQLLAYMRNVLAPSDDTTEEEVTKQFNAICLNSPDPMGACDLLVETPEPITAEQLLERIMALPTRDPATVPESELPLDHFYRRFWLGPPQ